MYIEYSSVYLLSTCNLMAAPASFGHLVGVAPVSRRVTHPLPNLSATRDLHGKAPLWAALRSTGFLQLILIMMRTIIVTVNLVNPAIITITTIISNRNNNDNNLHVPPKHQGVRRPLPRPFGFQAMTAGAFRPGPSSRGTLHRDGGHPVAVGHQMLAPRRQGQAAHQVGQPRQRIKAGRHGCSGGSQEGT